MLVLVVTSLAGNTPETLPRLESDIVGQRINAAKLDPDLAGHPGLILALRSDCPFCQQSMPFCRRLLARDRAGARIVVAAPPRDTGIGDYLAAESVAPDSVVFPAPGALPVPGTPTLLLVDSSGLVTHAWIGLLNADREREVFDALQ